MDPRTFEIEIHSDGTVRPGRGVLSAFVPATAEHRAVVAMSCDPRHDPGRGIQELAPAAMHWLAAELGASANGAVWTVIDNYGRFNEAVHDNTMVGASNVVHAIKFRSFPSGH